MRNIIIVLVAALLLFGGGIYLYKDKQQKEEKEKTKEFSEVLIRDHSPRYGNPDAKVTIVEFFDPACGACAHFGPLVKDLIKKYDGKVNLVYRYAPFHKNSDYIIAILEAARLQGKFDETLALLFKRNNLWVINHESQPGTALELLSKSDFDLDMQKIMADYSSEEILRRINQDYNDLTSLGVKQTPSFYVNGEKLEQFGYEYLVDLIDSQIALSYK